jgi:hypothetical protein
MLLAGCGGGDFPTARTKGTVMCKGKPVPKILVYFEPLRVGESAIVGKQGIGRADENGNFEVSTYGKNDGAVVGLHRVRVGFGGGTPNTHCDCEVNSEKNVIDKVEIKKGDVNVVNVVLAPKTARTKPSAAELEVLDEAKNRPNPRGSGK